MRQEKRRIVRATVMRQRGREHLDELPYGREADRGIFVVGMEILPRGTDEWAEEARQHGARNETIAAEDPEHHYVHRVFDECRRNVLRLAAEAIDTLNRDHGRADAAVAETVDAQADLAKARAELKRSERAVESGRAELSKVESQTGFQAGWHGVLGQGIPLVIGFALEAVLLWLALQNAEFGANWIRWLVVLLIAALVTFVAHAISSWITADWEQEPSRRRLHVLIGAAYALAVGGLLVSLAYIRSEDIEFANRSLSNPGLFRTAVLLTLFLVSVMASIFAGYAGYRHGRAAPTRHAARTLMQARSKAKKDAQKVAAAEAREFAASSAEEAAIGALHGHVERYNKAMSQVSDLARDIGNQCLAAENDGFTVKSGYWQDVNALSTHIQERAKEVVNRHAAIVKSLDERLDETRAQQPAQPA